MATNRARVSRRVLSRFARVTAGVTLCTGCAHDDASISAPAQIRIDRADAFIAEMDAAPEHERVPFWSDTRALMTRPAPEVGSPAPDFELPLRDGTGTVRLSELHRDVPVVLIFGSWT
jgi:hypothetical protein